MGEFLQDLWANLPHLFTWLREVQLRGNMVKAGWAPWAIDLTMSAIGIFAVSTFGLLLVIFTIWLERKVAGRVQDRLGPNRVGPFGLFQTFADVVKLLTKEDITPAGADRFLYNLAPFLALMAVLMLWAVVPFAPDLFGTEFNVGALYVVAVGSLGTLAILIAGWASNNKYALLGAFRTVAMLVSYEVPMILALLVPVLLARTMSINQIVAGQTIWYVVLSPIAALVFFISSLAEVGRAPFDLVEAESEIVSGYNIEYSGMKFGMFFVAEFLHAFTISALTATLFFGGWRGPGVDQAPILGVVYFFIKTSFFYFFVMLTRVTFPRIRIDHVLGFNWKFLVPLSLANVVLAAVLDKLPWAAVPLVDGAPDPSLLANLPRAATHLAGSLLLIVLTLALIRWGAERARRSAQAPVETEPAEPIAAEAHS